MTRTGNSMTFASDLLLGWWMDGAIGWANPRISLWSRLMCLCCCKIWQMFATTKEKHLLLAGIRLTHAKNNMSTVYPIIGDLRLPLPPWKPTHVYRQKISSVVNETLLYTVVLSPIATKGCTQDTGFSTRFSCKHYIPDSDLTSIPFPCKFWAISLFWGRWRTQKGVGA